MIEKINLGCGDDYREGYINLDLGNKNQNGDKIKVDISHNLNNYPYPFENNQFKEIYARGILEHIKDLDKGIGELSRISGGGCKVYIEVPYFLSYFSTKELNTHKFSLNSQIISIFQRNGFKLINKRLGYINWFLKPIELIINISDFTQNLCERFPLIIPNEIIWEFIKEKN